ncbi:MAG: insulinase family protein [Saprospiraceae bacterium]|nr:insulinase family protein [Saprospiraceae bacterium]
MLKTFSFHALLLLFTISLQAQNAFVTQSKTEAGYTYEYVTNDPTQTRIYTLKNGLKVYLSENHTEPRVMALLTTRAGSKNDPATNTGLAHYLEHMLFKGTDAFGSLDYTKEKAELDKIEALYEKYNSTKDEALRTRIYRDIDSISGVAANYAIANEYDKMMSNIGSNMTNAFTSFENTTYMENFPSNNLEKFLTIQDERFRNPVLRLFHTELEAVYEEKNISLDDGGNKVFESMFASLFRKHPYGTQTTIGTVEHLKNPSLTEIKKYFYNYYVPNNMCVILTGDIDANQTIAMVDKYFGDWKPKDVPKFTYEPEVKRTGVDEISVKSPDEESVAIGFIMPDQNHPEAVIADLVSSILYNGKSGLIDKNLVKKQKVLDAYGFTYLLKDYGIIYMGGNPLQNQTLQSVRDLLIQQINDLKEGNFDEDLIVATVNNLKVQRLQEQENNMNMAFVINDLFATDKSWEAHLKSIDRMSKITKADVVDFAKKWLGDSYTVVYKLTGEDNTVQKVVKPTITPVEVNRESQSAFLQQIVNNPNAPLKPVFLDYQKDITFGNVHKDVPVWSVQNKINGLFNAYYVLDMGSNHNQKLPLALEYLKYIGTSTMSNEAINKELYKLAVNFNVSASEDQVYVSFSGLDENFDAAVKLIETLLNDAKADQKALDNLVKSTIKSRNDATINKDRIFRDALDNYATFGAANPFNTVMSNDELRALKAEELTSILKSITGYKHKIYYFGPRTNEALVNHFKLAHTLPANLKAYPAEAKYERLEAKENTIYFVDYDMVQAEIQMMRNDEKFDAAKLPMISAFNEYYGGGMGSVVFQDIRESKALAYSTYSYYARPSKKEDPFEAGFYVGTQADKLGDAFAAMNNLLTTLPESEKNWEIGKKSIKQGFETRRISKTGILFNYQNALRLGIDHDVRKDIYEAVDGISLNDIKKFHNDHLKGKAWNIKVMGSKDKINMDELKKHGKVVELSLKDIFGYEVEKEDVIKP